MLCKENTEVFVSESEEATLLYAKKLAKKTLKKGLKIGIKGGLGAGKTIFVKGFLEDNIDKNDVKSPSFTIMNEYSTGAGNNFYHLDLYRVKSFDELEGTGFFDVILDPESIMFIEWFDNLELNNYYDKSWIFVEIEIIDDNKRKIKWRSCNT